MALPVFRGWGITVILILQLHNAAMSLLDASAHDHADRLRESSTLDILEISACKDTFP